MRSLFLLLVLANLAFFAWSRYFAPIDVLYDAEPLGRQIDPEKLRVLSAEDLKKIAPAQKKPPSPPPAEKPAAPLACLEWGSFTLSDAARAEKALEPLALGGRLAQRQAAETAGWWVFIPSMGSRPGALRKAAELRKLGVEDYFVLQEEGPHRWALSLGVYRSEEAAQARLAALRGRGVRSARVGERETIVPKIWLQVKNVDSALEARLREITRQVAGAEVKSCP